MYYEPVVIRLGPLELSRKETCSATLAYDDETVFFRRGFLFQVCQRPNHLTSFAMKLVTCVHDDSGGRAAARSESVRVSIVNLP
ncbi:hypothetical protein IF1G_02690 [Cordyceps javanica]|uniref:Uncharacterized protein n=1 Tax=Cordyceps javanica TaxID=43265 RepID=A0A545VA64_9HYPO|nr:hypothetical protein IF1G_02690 [Cordyceps javanica]